MDETTTTLESADILQIMELLPHRYPFLMVDRIVGIDSDRLFPVVDQHLIAANIPHTVNGDEAVVISSTFGHDGFLIEDHLMGAHIRGLLEY